MFNARLSVRKMAVTLSSAALILMLHAPVQAETINLDLEFSSANQSMWGTGGAFQLDETNFYGTTWNERGSVGGFVGGNTQIINPLWLAWKICPFFCGSEPTKHFNVDTSTGLEVSATTTGRIGFEVGLKIDSGSVNAVAGYAISVDIPDTADYNAGDFVSLNDMGTLGGDDLNSQFPTMSASLAVVMEVSATFAASGCILGACDSASFSTGTIGGTQELISFNEDGQGGIEYFGGTGILSDILDAAVATGLVDLPTGFPAVLEVPAPGTGVLATITVHLPQPNTTYDGTDGTSLFASGQDDLLDISLDVDNIISVAVLGVGGLFGGGEDLGAGFSISYDLINVEMGPQIDLKQTFELTPTLFVDLQFSQPVAIAGIGTGLMALNGVEWGSLPDFAFFGGETVITPTFYLGTSLGGAFSRNAAELFNRLFLDIDGNVKVDLLTATFGTPFGDLTIGIGNLFDESFDIFTTPAIFSSNFKMVGFNDVVGPDWVVRVPAPGTLWLLGFGLTLMGAKLRRREIH